MLLSCLNDNGAEDVRGMRRSEGRGLPHLLLAKEVASTGEERLRK
jgi:hypothetical protein